jgi:Ca2+-binding RTX toxin-like protein
MRMSAVAAAGCAVALAHAGTALAAPTKIPQSTSGIKVIAAPGTVNNITIDYGVFQQLENGLQIDDQEISDTAGLSVVSGEDQVCGQPVQNTTKCVDTGTLAGVPNGTTGSGEDPSVLLGDGNDTLVSDSVGELTVFGGPGNDRMIGGSRPSVFADFEGGPPTIVDSSENFNGGGGNDVLIGNGQPDLLNGGSGNDILNGGPGRDSLYGGAGNDFLNARDGHRDAVIDCGPGNDRAKVDKVDPKPISC